MYMIVPEMRFGHRVFPLAKAVMTMTKSVTGAARIDGSRP
jgi:hypothetical protein